MITNLRLSRYVVVSESLHVRRTGFEGRVIFSTRSGTVLTIATSAWRSIEQSRFEELPSKTRSALVNAKVLVPSEEDELAVVVQENIDAIAVSDVLYQVIQPSAWCQLDCTYCGQQHAKQTLGSEGQKAFLERLRARLATAGYRHLKIGWFGAEPLTGLSVIRSLSADAQKLASEFACSYSARIVTNGLGLSVALARELVRDHSILEAEITLDGLAAQHDKSRFKKAGGGTFDKILANIVSVALNTDMRIVVRCNVERSNAEGVKPLIETLAAQGLAPMIGFYTSPVYAWGNDAHKTALDKEDYARLEIEWLALQARLGFKVGLIPPRRPIVCLSVQRHGEVLDAYGTTYNCTEVPYVPAYGRPSSYEIRIPVSGIAVRSRDAEVPALKLRNFNQRIIEGKQPECERCAMLPVCGGHCPKAWQEGHDPCPSAKINMRDRLNLLFAICQLPN